MVVHPSPVVYREHTRVGGATLNGSGRSLPWLLFRSRQTKYVPVMAAISAATTAYSTLHLPTVVSGIAGSSTRYQRFRERVIMRRAHLPCPYYALPTSVWERVLRYGVRVVS